MWLAVYMTIQAIAQTQKSIHSRTRCICVIHIIYERLVIMASGMGVGQQKGNSFMTILNPME